MLNTPYNLFKINNLCRRLTGSSLLALEKTHRWNPACRNPDAADASIAFNTFPAEKKCELAYECRRVGVFGGEVEEQLRVLSFLYPALPFCRAIKAFCMRRASVA